MRVKLTKDFLYQEYIINQQSITNIAKNNNYSIVQLVFAKTRKSWKNTTASLDRIDSNLGYKIDNIQWLHKIVQTIKWDKTTKETINWCKIIAKYNR